MDQTSAACSPIRASRTGRCRVRRSPKASIAPPPDAPCATASARTWWPTCPSAYSCPPASTPARWSRRRCRRVPRTCRRSRSVSTMRRPRLSWRERWPEPSARGITSCGWTHRISPPTGRAFSNISISRRLTASILITWREPLRPPASKPYSPGPAVTRCSAVIPRLCGSRARSRPSAPSVRCGRWSRRLPVY